MAHHLGRIKAAELHNPAFGMMAGSAALNSSRRRPA